MAVEENSTSCDVSEFIPSVSCGRELLERVHFESFLCETFLYYDCIVVFSHMAVDSPLFCPVYVEVVRLLSSFSCHLECQGPMKTGEYKNYVSFRVPAPCPVKGPSAVYPPQFLSGRDIQDVTKLVERSGCRNTRKTADYECLFYT